MELNYEGSSSVHLVVAWIATEPTVVRVRAQSRTGDLVAIAETISTICEEREIERGRDELVVKLKDKITVAYRDMEAAQNESSDIWSVQRSEAKGQTCTTAVASNVKFGLLKLTFHHLQNIHGWCHSTYKKNLGLAFVWNFAVSFYPTQGHSTALHQWKHQILIMQCKE